MKGEGRTYSRTYTCSACQSAVPSQALQTVRPAKRSLPLSPESLYSLPCVKTPSQTKAPSPLSLFSFANAHIYAVLRRPRIDGQSYHLSCHYSQRDLELRPRT